MPLNKKKKDRIWSLLLPYGREIQVWLYNLIVRSLPIARKGPASPDSLSQYLSYNRLHCSLCFSQRKRENKFEWSIVFKGKRWVFMVTGII